MRIYHILTSLLLRILILLYRDCIRYCPVELRIRRRYIWCVPGWVGSIPIMCWPILVIYTSIIKVSSRTGNLWYTEPDSSQSPQWARKNGQNCCRPTSTTTTCTSATSSCPYSNPKPQTQNYSKT